MNKVHVYRAGNMAGKMQTEEKKKIIIRNLLDNGSYTKAIMYDDAIPNLESFVELKKEYPKTKFYAWQVSLDGEASEYHRTNETQTLEERKKKKKKTTARFGAYGPGPYGWYGYDAGYSGDGGGGDGGGGESIQHEASYEGNIGAMETFKFYQMAKEKEKALLKLLIKKGNYKLAWYLIQKVTGVKLQGDEFALENFADGKNPQDKGDSKRHGVPTKASVSTLRKVAKQGGRKGQLAHWMANMKAGKAKKK
jgi:hypothetical protein